MITLKNIKFEIQHNDKDINNKIIKTLKINKNDLLSYEIIKKSLDSRNKDNIFYVYNFNINVKNEKKVLHLKNVQKAKNIKYEEVKLTNEKYKKRPVIIGTGPAGLLAGIVLAQAGLKPILIEQGKEVTKRAKDIQTFWKTGQLNETSNVQFGAGGAGTFSDGKLTTGVNNPLKAKVIKELINAGANENIKYVSKPHLGTDELIKIVYNICLKIEDLGGEILFETKFIDFEVEENKLSKIKILNNQKEKTLQTDYMILAIGHSARDTFYKLYEKKINIKPKPFAVGFRIEHLQSDVNKSQYGKNYKLLEPASYKLNTKIDNRTLHTFCMCPGGVVVGASSEKNMVVCNGMSYSKRNLINSNSALLVNINIEDYDGQQNPLNGIKFQRDLEKKAFEAGGKSYYAPVQKVGDFLENKKSENFTKVIPSYLPGYKSVNLNEVFDQSITKTIKEALIKMSEKIDFLKDKEAVLTAIESRSSSPITIIRDKKLMSNIYGIYPCGEGAGYAGGITSSAIDGIRCANMLINEINEKK